MNHFILRRRQGGIVLLEALIAIVIFAFGILGLLGLQAHAINQSADAKFRSDASLLADQLIGKMWVSNRDAATLQAAFSSPNGAQYTAWKGSDPTPAAGTVFATLPRQANTPAPSVVITQVAGEPGVVTATTSSVSVTLYWQAPHETTRHQYTVVTQIR